MPSVTFIGAKMNKQTPMGSELKKSFEENEAWDLSDEAVPGGYTVSVGLGGVPRMGLYIYTAVERSVVTLRSPYSPEKTTRVMLDSTEYSKCLPFRVRAGKLEAHIREGYVRAPERSWVRRRGPVLVILPACPGPWKHRSVFATIGQYQDLIARIKSHTREPVWIRFHPNSSSYFKHTLTHVVKHLAIADSSDLDELYCRVGRVVSNWGTLGAMFAMRGIPVFNLSGSATITQPIAKTSLADLAKPKLSHPMTPWEYGEWVASHVFSLDEIRDGQVPDFVLDNARPPPPAPAPAPKKLAKKRPKKAGKKP